MPTQDHPADALDTLRRRRDDGITFLDSRDDLADWRDIIDLNILDMSGGDDCILGQLAHHLPDPAIFDSSARGTCFYDRMVFLLGLSSRQAGAFGFALDPAEPFTYKDLTAVWTEALTDTAAA